MRCIARKRNNNSAKSANHRLQVGRLSSKPFPFCSVVIMTVRQTSHAYWRVFYLPFALKGLVLARCDMLNFTGVAEPCQFFVFSSLALG